MRDIFGKEHQNKKALIILCGPRFGQRDKLKRKYAGIKTVSFVVT